MNQSTEITAELHEQLLFELHELLDIPGSLEEIADRAVFAAGVLSGCTDSPSARRLQASIDCLHSKAESEMGLGLGELNRIRKLRDLPADRSQLCMNGAAGYGACILPPHHDGQDHRDANGYTWDV